MAGNQVVPRLACPAFQEWTPRVHSFFSSISVLGAELLRKKSSAQLTYLLTEQFVLQDMISVL